MGLFSVRGRLPQPAKDKAPVRLHLPDTLTQLAHLVGGGMKAGLRRTGRLAIAATNDARIVAVLLVLAALALGLEMAASFHVI